MLLKSVRSSRKQSLVNTVIKQYTHYFDLKLGSAHLDDQTFHIFRNGWIDLHAVLHL